MDSKPLPEFARPPVIETVLGMHFEAFGKFHNAHLGAFWKTLPPDWGQVADAPVLPEQTESFDGSKSGARNLGIVFTNQPEVRMQIRNERDNRMLQLQNGQLHYNWLGHGGDEYARYPSLRLEFDEIRRRFEEFASKESLGELKPLQWEITYVNQFPRDTVWNSPEDWSSLFRSIPAPIATVGGAKLESFGGEWHYEIGGKRGRLHVKASHGRRGKPHNDEVVSLTLTARGPVDSKTGDPVGVGLDLGRDTIVRAFRDLTSERAHQVWGIQNA
jgi:uncharacterized protein (TIGR04255 family)